VARDEAENFLVHDSTSVKLSETSSASNDWAGATRGRGEILVGTSQGALWVFDLAGRPLRQVKRVGGGVVRTLEATADGDAVLGVWASKAMRVMDGQRYVLCLDV